MKKLLLAVGASAWFVVLFVITFFLTFPSDAVIDRLRWEVSDRSRDEYAVTLDDLGPWWLGASAQGVKVYQAPRRGADKELAFLFSDVRGAVSPLSAISRAPRVSGSVTPIDGTLHYTVGTGRTGKRQDLSVTELVLSAEGFPLSEVMLLGGLTGSAVGGVDIDVDLGGTDGMRTGSGNITISGKNLVLSDLELPGIGPLGMELPLDEVALNVKVDEGEAQVVRGDIRSPLLTTAISGSVRLRDDLARSSVDIEVVLSNLGSELKMFEPFLTQGDIGGGKYQISCAGTLSDPRCSLGKGRSSSSSRRSTRPTRSRPTPIRSGADGGSVERPDVDELRKRREERLERLRALREQRSGNTTERDLPEDEGDILDEDEFLDEEDEFLDEEEEFLDDEEFIDEEFDQ